MIDIRGTPKERDHKPDTEHKPLRDAKGRVLPGQSLNPRGRSKAAEDFSSIVRDILARKRSVKVGTKKRNLPTYEILLLKLVELGGAGSVKAIQILFEYGYGGPPQRHEVTGEGGGPLEILFPAGFDRL